MKAGIEDAGNDWNIASNSLRREFDKPYPCLLGKRTIFSGASERHNAIDALLLEPGKQVRGSLLVDGVVNRP